VTDEQTDGRQLVPISSTITSVRSAKNATSSYNPYSRQFVAPAGVLRSVGRRGEVNKGEVDLLTGLHLDDPRRVWTTASSVRRQ